MGSFAHHHCFGGGGGLVKQRSVGYVESGEIADHGLEVEEGFQPALRDLGLVGRVLGVPAWILQNVAEDDGRGDGIVIPHADKRSEGLVLGGDFSHFGQHVGFRARRGQCELALEPNRGRNGLLDQGVQGVYADGLQHSLLVFAARSQMTIDERIGSLQQIHMAGGGPSRGIPGLLRVSFGKRLGRSHCLRKWRRRHGIGGS